MSNHKMQWTRPQLIVLTRGTPEERVLTDCKRIGDKTSGVPTSTAQLGCDKGADKTCGACLNRSTT